jgi:hypothetical protein
VSPSVAEEDILSLSQSVEAYDNEADDPVLVTRIFALVTIGISCSVVVVDRTSIPMPSRQAQGSNPVACYGLHQRFEMKAGVARNYG